MRVQKVSDPVVQSKCCKLGRLGSNNFFWQSSRRDFRMNILVLNQQQLNLERDNIVRKRSNKGFKKNARGKKNVSSRAPYPQGILTIKNITHSVFSFKAFQLVRY